MADPATVKGTSSNEVSQEEKRNLMQAPDQPTSIFSACR